MVKDRLSNLVRPVRAIAEAHAPAASEARATRAGGTMKASDVKCGFCGRVTRNNLDLLRHIGWMHGVVKSHMTQEEMELIKV